MCIRDSIITSSRDKKIKVWNFKTLTLAFELQTEDVRIYTLTLSPDNKYLVAGVSGYKMQIWDLHERRFLNEFKFVHSNDIKSIVISSDNKLIISGQLDGTLSFWNLETRQLIYKNMPRYQVLSMAMTSDNKYLIQGTTTGQIIAWDIQSKKMISIQDLSQTDQIKTVFVSNKNKYMLAVTSEGYFVLFELFYEQEEEDDDYVFEDAHSDDVDAVAVTRDSKYMITGSRDRSIKIWDFQTKKLLYTIENAHKETVTSLTFTSDDKYILSASRDRSVKQWTFAKLIQKIDSNQSKGTKQDL
eukprot:TRINITY_DN884_c0_g4_i4.p1 TRINITY_DN884_c0_g4~~TRINITY_DN884_c0_g4_i4.p1  ORF type:complete len:300 (-),score=52.67 TRINITY_DN884_c0_g4_i4:159-1058(-)